MSFCMVVVYYVLHLKVESFGCFQAGWIPVCMQCQLYQNNRKIKLNKRNHFYIKIIKCYEYAKWPQLMKTVFTERQTSTCLGPQVRSWVALRASGRSMTASWSCKISETGRLGVFKAHKFELLPPGNFLFIATAQPINSTIQLPQTLANLHTMQFLKTLGMISLFAIAVSAGPGKFANTCREVEGYGSSLRAECREHEDGEMRQSTIDINRCIKNHRGSLKVSFLI